MPSNEELLAYKDNCYKLYTASKHGLAYAAWPASRGAPEVHIIGPLACHSRLVHHNFRLQPVHVAWLSPIPSSRNNSDIAREFLMWLFEESPWKDAYLLADDKSYLEGVLVDPNTGIGGVPCLGKFKCAVIAYRLFWDVILADEAVAYLRANGFTWFEICFIGGHLYSAMGSTASLCLANHQGNHCIAKIKVGEIPDVAKFLSGEVAKDPSASTCFMYTSGTDERIGRGQGWNELLSRTLEEHGLLIPLGARAFSGDGGEISLSNTKAVPFPELAKAIRHFITAIKEA